MIVTREITLNSKGNCDIIDITPQVKEHLAQSGVSNGTATIFVTGSTAGVTTIEYEPGLQADFKAAWERIAPENIPYEHNERWGDGNGFSHIRASILGASLVVPFKDKKLLLGTWQQIVLTDFDNRPRSRQIIVQITGE
jgi:secondary thiamine-phosphate synthase enzyme